MKVLYQDSYSYLGVTPDGWHLFKCSKENFDEEYLLLERARVIQKDGSSKYYDPVQTRSSITERLLAYADQFKKSGVCVNFEDRREPNPKRRVARVDSLVSYKG